ncbi:MAG: hypothetical protein JWO35_31 [Candidatus Saccharibacteria bacterium]|nr:hypothetical protein [Candidatus Saccharibacteria bacterium]
MGPAVYHIKKMKTQKRRRARRPLYLFFVLVVISGYSSWVLLRPLAALNPIPRSSTVRMDTAPATLSWPVAGQSAVGILGTDISALYGKQTPVPIASTAKVITALVVLEKKPLKQGEQGSVITLTPADVALYENYKAIDGSLLPVVAGEQISEYQMMQAIMLPSANNIADTMAIWAYGSLPAYADAANAYLAAHGLTNTHVGSDASGLSPSTTSTAEDLVKLGKLAMQHTVLAEVVGQSTAAGIPLTSSIKNVNSLLGTNNIIGIKTGNTDEAGGVFMSASRITINSKPITIITAVAGSPNLFGALKDSLTLIKSAQVNFATVQLVKAGDILGRYQLPQGGSVAAVAAKDLKLVGWKGPPVLAQMRLQPLASKDASSSPGLTAGSVTIPESVLTNQQSIAVELKTVAAEPSALWRLTHPLN